MKGGSTVGIPSPPAIWIPHAPTGAKFVTPGIEDAEALQGFERGCSSSFRRFTPTLKEHVVFMRGDGSPESKDTPSRRLDIRRTQHAVD
jgi:hypothetical protein